ncbi:DUF4301 family protein [Oligoflexus tunisiensis]|uniref:DUF4301 family protein n=1 Tax=Oligoflexus tunisiensis TaxID=708132 RepID=UPI00114CF14E|nr:DUF4301 family protein [Oligoflexus tunisiensis]
MLKGMSVAEIRDLNLDVHDIQIHQQRITEGVKNRDDLFIPVEDTCRLENGGILPPRYLHQIHRDKAQGFAAFVPAAGAASRYFKPLMDLRQALEEGDQEKIEAQHRSLRQQDASSWPLPLHLTQFITQERCPRISAEEAKDIITEIDLPKALLPCWKDGPTFLQMKQQEHEKIHGIMAEYYVAPLEQSGLFAEHLAGKTPEDAHPLYFLEQGEQLSTLRFRPDGMPYRTPEGKLSIVPAGHGMLVKLFQDVRQKTPTAHSLFIRNIDNVNGWSREVQDETELFLVQHQMVLATVRRIRQSLHSDDLTTAAQLADELLQNMVNPRPIPTGSWLKELERPWLPLWKLLVQGFHCPESHALRMRRNHQDKRALKELYDRPVNTLGQVPNSGKDIGGTPVFAHTKDGEVSICLELPHVSAVDRKRFLEDPTKATHFNPVFVAAEIPEHSRAYDLENCPFWILAEKTMHGEPVVYHEIVLYEVIGNSLTANVLYPEISRKLFHPHKTLLDGVKPMS